jgi:hypothetical protein
VLVVVIAGNPSAGGAFPWPMLPPFWRAIGPWLPPGAGTWTARSIAYFHGNAVTTSLLVLSAYAVAGAIVTLLVTLRPPGRHVAPAGTVPAVPRSGRTDAGTPAGAVPRARHAASGELKAARDETGSASGERGAAPGAAVAAPGESGAAPGESQPAQGETRLGETPRDKTETAHGETEAPDSETGAGRGESKALSGPEGPRADQG